MAFFVLWWTFDDTLAEAVASPGLGTLPIWVPLLFGLALSWTTEAQVAKHVGSQKKRK